MSQRCEIKICGMKDRSNIEQIAALCPDYIGCIFAPSSPRFFGAVPPQDSLRNLATHSRFVAVLVSPKMEDLVSLTDCGEFEVLQIHGEVAHDTLEQVKVRNPAIRYWRAINLASEADLSATSADSGLFERIIFDGKNSGAGVPFDWKIVQGYVGTLPYMIAGGVGPDNVKDVFSIFGDDARFVGIDLNSKVEVSPGLKDPQIVKRVIASVKGVV